MEKSLIRFDLIPHEGILPFRFGMGREDVEEFAGPAREVSSPSVRYFASPALLTMNFDGSGELIFVEVSWDSSTLPQVLYRGVDLFGVSADTAITTLAQDAAFVPRERGTSALFPDTDVALWRPVVPSGAAVNDVEDEYRNGKYWMTVGAGMKGFLVSAGIL